MKQILFFLITIIAFFLTGCNTTSVSNEQQTTQPSVDIATDSVTKITLQFQDNYADITDENQISNILKIFTDLELDKERSKETLHGWIYAIRLYDENGNELREAFVIDEATLNCEDKIYKSNNISLELLDEYSGFDRFQS